MPSRLTRDDDTRIKLVADGAPVPDGRLFDIAFFASADEGIAAAAACAHYLEKMPADEKGWHPFPREEVLRLLLADMKLLGLSSRAIALELTTLGVATPSSGRWHPQTVMRALSRAAL